MKLTEKQRKGLWIAGVALILVHLGRGWIINLWQARHHPVSRPSATHIAPPPIQPVAVLPVIDPQFIHLSGIWVGKIVRPGGTTCGLRLELRPSQAKPGDFTGYSVLSCGPSFLQIPGGPASVRTPTAFLTRAPLYQPYRAARLSTGRFSCISIRPSAKPLTDATRPISPLHPSEITTLQPNGRSRLATTGRPSCKGARDERHLIQPDAGTL